MKTYKEMAKSIGKGDQYFSMMRRSNRELFEYIYRIGDGDLSRGYIRFNDKKYELRSKLATLYYELQETKTASHFSKYLCDCGVFSHDLSFTTGLPKIAFTNSEYMSFDTFNRWVKVLNLYRIYKARSKV